MAITGLSNYSRLAPIAPLAGSPFLRKVQSSKRVPLPARQYVSGPNLHRRPHPRLSRRRQQHIHPFSNSRKASCKASALSGFIAFCVSVCEWITFRRFLDFSILTSHEFSFLWIPDNEVSNTALLYSFLWRQLTSTAKSRRTPMEPIREMLHVLKLNIYVVLFQHRMLASNVLGISTSDHLPVNSGNPNSVIGVLRSLP